MEIETIKSDVGMSWKSVKIPEVLFFQEGPGVRNTQFTTSGVKLLNVGNINFGDLNLDATKVHISEEEAYGKYSHFLIDEGDLLIASSGIVVDNFHNKITWAKKEHLPLCLNTSTIRFRTLDHNILDIKYFSYFLKTRLFADQLSKLITGSAQLNFGPSHLKQISLPLPPLATQKRIAEILDAADALRRKDQELLKKYDELAQAIFIDMFGDPELNEKGWRKRKIDEVLIFPLGLVDPKSKPYAEMLHVGGDNIESGTGRIFKLMKASELNLKSGKFHFTDKHILYNKIRPRLNKVACPDFEGICSADMYPLLPLGELVKKEYLYFILRSKLFLDFAENQSRRANIPKINMKEMADFEFPVPDIENQNQFIANIRKVNALKIHQFELMDYSSSLFNTLIQKAFKGELV